MVNRRKHLVLLKKSNDRHWSRAKEKPKQFLCLRRFLWFLQVKLKFSSRQTNVQLWNRHEFRRDLFHWHRNVDKYFYFSFDDYRSWSNEFDWEREVTTIECHENFRSKNEIDVFPVRSLISMVNEFVLSIQMPLFHRSNSVKYSRSVRSRHRNKFDNRSKWFLDDCWNRKRNFLIEIESRKNDENLTVKTDLKPIPKVKRNSMKYSFDTISNIVRILSSSNECKNDKSWSLRILSMVKVIND